MLKFLLPAVIAPIMTLIATDRPPNIVVILVDDLGYADLGAQGSSEVITPRIDSLARDGMRFSDAYVTAAQCAPSRAGLVTGRYQQRFGFDVNLGWERSVEGKLGLPKNEPTIAGRLQAAGYRTGVIGKWDLGTGPGQRPNDRGFDEFYGFLGGSRQHPPHQDTSINTMLRNGKPVEETDWSSDIYSQEAADFIARNREVPFFLYLSFTAPHWPMQAKPEDLALFAHVEDTHRRTFLAMMAGLDRGVGKVLDAIEKNGLDQETLVFFLSDNGGATGLPRTAPDAPFAMGINLSSNHPLRNQKGTLYEGGIRVPFLARWTGVIKPGRVEATPVISLDIAATAAALAGIPADSPPPIDGVSLLPLLKGTGTLPERPLFWRVKNQFVVRDGDCKFLRFGNNPPELYNLAADIGETDNLIDKEPERAAALKKTLDQWRKDLPPPAW